MFQNQLSNLISQYYPSDYISIQVILIVTLQVILAKEEFWKFNIFVLERLFPHPPIFIYLTNYELLVIPKTCHSYL